VWASPCKGQHNIGSSDSDNEAGRDEEEEKEDTKALLEKTEETVEEMKRQRSEIPGGRIVVDVRKLAIINMRTSHHFALKSTKAMYLNDTTQMIVH
jgi:hypothetical protein